MCIIYFCMRTANTFEGLNEQVAIQVGLDVNKPEDMIKSKELTSWMLGEGYSSIVMTHASISAEKKGMYLKYIALIGAIIGVISTLFSASGCANTSFALSGEQGQISYSVDGNGNLLISANPPVVQDFKK